MPHSQRLCIFGQSDTSWLVILVRGNESGMSRAQSRGTMSHLMKLAEALRDIAEVSSKREIEQALGLCTGFADRVSGQSTGDAKRISLYPRTSMRQPSLARTWSNNLRSLSSTETT
jgi:hypothetical protein